MPLRGAHCSRFCTDICSDDVSAKARMNVKIGGKLRHELNSKMRFNLTRVAAIISNSRFGFYEKILREVRISAESHQASGTS